MATVADALEALEQLAPRELAYSFDKVGLQVGGPTGPLTHAVVALDRSLGAVRYARSIGAQLLVAHHPLIWEPLETVDPRTHIGQTISELIQADIAFVAAHTNWDTAWGGVNCTLAERLGLLDVEPFGSGASASAFKLVFFCPEKAASAVIDALAAAGAGAVGLYRRCAFQSAGMGTFEAQPGATPAVGAVGSRETVAEFRVEMRVPKNRQAAVRLALQSSHPYEEPAADWVPLEPEIALAIGRVGRLPKPLSLVRFAQLVDSQLGTRSTTWGAPDSQVERIAVVGGAADDEWRAASAAGAQVLVTGEVKQHVALEASESGFALIAAGHYATENPGCASLRDHLATLLPDVQWQHYEPEPGSAGRPLA